VNHVLKPLSRQDYFSSLLDVSKLNFMRDESGTVHATTSMTKDQVKALPEHHH
jgi:hypothetical protein